MARGRFTDRPHRPVNATAIRAQQPRRSIVASAAYINREQYRVAFADRPQAAQAWKYYYKCGVIRFGVDWLASACSRARLYIGRIDPDGAADPEPVDDLAYQQVMNTFAGGQSGQAQLIKRAITHLGVPGETFLLDLTATDLNMWVAATSSEIETRTGQTSYILDEKNRIPIDEASNDVLRIWRSDPVRAWEPTSNVYTLVDEAAQLCALNAHVLASADSRLAGAGILTVPESATIAAATQAQEQQVLDDPFMNDLTNAMMTPLEDRSSAAAVVPIVLRVPDESVSGIKHIPLSTPFDAQVPDLIDSVTKKIALGLDAPPELVLGIGDTNHWNAEAIDAQSVRVHVEPNLQVLTDGLTRKWLPGALQAAGLAWTPDLVVWADTSDLTQEPDRSETALEYYKLGILTPQAVARYGGFTDTDVNPNAVPPTAGQQAPAVEPPTEPAQVEAAPYRPQLAASAPAQAWGVDRCELAVLRALELAGKRLLNPTLRGRYRQVQPWELHTRIRASVADLDRLMDGAWDQLEALDAPGNIVACLDSYTRNLIANGRPHDARLLDSAISLRQVVA